MNSILLVNRPKLSRLHGYLYVRSILHNISKFGIYAAEIPNSDSFTVDIVDLSAVSSQISSRVFSAELLSTSRVATLLATAVEERISAQLKELFGIDDKENLQVLEERLRTQLKEESGYNESSSEYKKYWTRIPEVAQLYVKTFTVRAVHELQEELQVNFLDAPFEFIGRKWLLVEQYDEALAAFTKSVEISKREGPWWPQILCARHCYLAFVQAILGKKKQQLRTSLMGAAFAVAFKNSALETDLASSMLFNCSLFNLFIYLLDCKIDQQSWYDFHASVIGPFQKQMVQTWDKHLADRSCTLEKTLVSGKQGVITEEDFLFSLANFLVHSNQHARTRLLDMLKSSCSRCSTQVMELLRISHVRYNGKLPLELRNQYKGFMEDLLILLSAADPNCGGRVTKELSALLKLCQMDKLDMNQDVVRVTQPGSVSCWKDFAVEVLKVATLEVPSKFPGWFLSWPFSARLPFLGYPFGEINGEVIPHAYPCIEIEELELPVPGGRQAESSSGPSSIPAREAHIEEVERVVYAFNSRLKMGTERGAALEELAHTGRDLAFWVRSAWTSASSASTSASTAASIPPENIRLTLVRLHTFSTILMIHKRVDLSKTMLQDLIMWLLDQTNFQFKEECLDLLVDYSEICALTYDREEQMNCCRKGLTLAKADRLLFWQFRFHLKLADFYLCMSNATQAEEELVSARHVMTQTSEPAKDELFMAQLEGCEGQVELLKGMACFLHEERCSVHLRKALTLTKGAVEKLDRMDKASLPEMSTWIRTLMMLSNMYMKVGQFSEASLTSRRAYEDAKKNLYGLAPTAALAYGAAAVELAELSDAERLYREELQQLKARGYADEVLIARLQGGLGRVLMKQSGRLDEAEAELRQAANACGRFIFEKHLTSHHRIEAFEQLKFLYSELQSCLYSIYKESPDERKGIRARDALIVAEQGRCRDLMFNLENRRGEDSENTGFTLDWKKFDTDAEYAWEQLEECMTVCVNAIKKRNKEVQRVTFVEFTLTFGNLIIWVLQSHGTPELSSSSQAAKDLVPEMFCVDIKDFIIDAKEELPTALEDYKMTYGSELGEHHYSKRLQRSQALEAHSKIEDVINKLRDGDPDDRALNSLYKLLIKPFAKKLGKEEPVIFIPHEGISFVPFAALKGPGMKGKYFIENHPIGTAYSLRSLGWAVNRYTTLRGTSGISSQDQLLLVADPSPLGVNKDPLPQSIQEVNAIASHFPRPSVILSGERATLEEVTSHMSRSSWFHISCHGDVSTEYPQGVLFLSCSGDSEWAAKASRRYAASDYEDLIFNSGGYLTPAVILNNVRWMPAHAAVLAACNVGKGKKAGEGLIGLSRALTQAGVPLVVAPLKSVLSEHASEFMQRLYKKLVAGESMMFALRNTMRDIIESNAAKKKAGEESGWPLWEWAAWLPVGFPGVCLPFCNVTEESPLELDC